MMGVMARRNPEFTDDDDALLGELGVEPEAKKQAKHTPREERILAGFEEVQRFADEHGRAPGHGGEDVFERIYAVRLDRMRQSEEMRTLLAPLDAGGLLAEPASAVRETPAAYDTDDELLEALGVGAEDATGVTTLKHVRSASEKRAAEEVAQRDKCEDFAAFRPGFEAVQAELAAGLRKTAPFEAAGERTIREGDLFVLGGQKALVAEVGERYINDNGNRDARLRVVYDNATQSRLLLRSLVKALTQDDASRRILPSDAAPPPLFSASEFDESDTGAGFIYALRSQSVEPFLAAHRETIHKLGVTGGSVEKRVANAAKDPTFLLAPVEVVATWKLANVNRFKLEKLLHGFFAEARLDLQLRDRFNAAVEPREWFLVPLPAIRGAVELLLAGRLAEHRYDRGRAEVVPTAPNARGAPASTRGPLPPDLAGGPDPRVVLRITHWPVVIQCFLGCHSPWAVLSGGSGPRQHTDHGLWHPVVSPGPASGCVSLASRHDPENPGGEGEAEFGIAEGGVCHEAGGERGDDEVFDRALQGAGAVAGVEAEAGELVDDGGVEGEREAAAGEAASTGDAAQVETGDAADGVAVERVEGGDGVEAVDELRAEGVERRGVGVGAGGLVEAEGAGDAAGEVGGKQQEAPAEVGDTAVVVDEAALVEHAQQEVEDVGVGLLDLVEQQHLEGLKPQPAEELAGAAAGRRHQALPGAGAGVLAHVQADHPLVGRPVGEQEVGEGLGALGLAGAGGSAQQHAGERAVRRVEGGLEGDDQVGEQRAGLRLNDHAIGEEAEDFLTLQRQVVAQEPIGQAGEPGEAVEHDVGVHRLVERRGEGEGVGEEPDRPAGQRGAGQEAAEQHGGHLRHHGVEANAPLLGEAVADPLEQRPGRRRAGGVRAGGRAAPPASPGRSRRQASSSRGVASKTTRRSPWAMNGAKNAAGLWPGPEPT